MDDEANRARASCYTLVAGRLAVQVAGRKVVLTMVQFRLLEALMSEPGRTFTRKHLVTQVCNESVSERAIDVHIKDLRHRLKPDAGLIETVRRQGYRYRGAAM
jgi:two-component system alkaline phosphatase synthesis response regulator PhoP